MPEMVSGFFLSVMMLLNVKIFYKMRLCLSNIYVLQHICEKILKNIFVINNIFLYLQH